MTFHEGVKLKKYEIMQIRKYIDTCMLIFQGFCKRLHLLWHKFTVESIRSDIRNTFLSELRNMNWGTEKMQVCTNSLMWIEEGNRWWLPQQGRQFLQMWWQLTSHFNTGSDRQRPYTEMHSHWSHHQERMSWLHSQCRFLGWLWEVSLTGLHFWRHLLSISHLACLSGGNTYNDRIICKVGGNLLSEAMIRVSRLFSFGN